MKFIKSFVKKPRNVYFSIIAMLTVVSGLVSISFSYFIDESSTEGVMEFKEIDNRIQSPDLVDGNIALAPHETKEIELYIMSNNNMTTKYKLVYDTDKNVKIYTDQEMDETIEAKEVKNYKLTVSNFEDTSVQFELKILSSNINTDITTNSKIVEVLE